MNALLETMYPELRALGPHEQRTVLERARETPFDTVELLGMAAAIVVVTGLTRYGVQALDVAEVFTAALLNFVVALPLLAAGLAPFLVRRAKRGLRDQLERRPRG